MTDVSVPEVNMLKNSSTLAVCVPIHFTVKLGFVSVNDLRETYLVAALSFFEFSPQLVYMAERTLYYYILLFE